MLFRSEDRSENIRRTAEAAKLMTEAGLITLVSLVSPSAADRETAREIVGEEFVEIYVSASPETCASRDKKGYYQKAKEGKIKDFTGVSASYEPPLSPDLLLDTERLTPAECADKVLGLITAKRY